MDILHAIAKAFEEGGTWMYGILLMQIFTIAIVIERAVTLFGKRKVSQKALANTFERDIRRGDLEAVVEAAKKLEGKEPLARVVVAGANAAYNLGGQTEIQGKMDEVLLEENAVLERRVGFLAMLGNVATLTGLLGTITGMIKSFAAVSQVNPTEKATALSAGISEAMNCTAYGLVVAIPALVAYAIVQNRSTLLSEDLNQAALKVFNWLSYSYETVPARPARKETRQAEATIN